MNGTELLTGLFHNQLQNDAVVQFHHVVRSEHGKRSAMENQRGGKYFLAIVDPGPRAFLTGPCQAENRFLATPRPDDLYFGSAGI